MENDGYASTKRKCNRFCALVREVSTLVGIPKQRWLTLETGEMVLPGLGLVEDARPRAVLLKRAFDGMLEILGNRGPRFRSQLSDCLHHGPAPASTGMRLQDADQIPDIARLFSKPARGNQRFGTLKLFALAALNIAHGRHGLPGSPTVHGSLAFDPVVTTFVPSLQDVLVAFSANGSLPAFPRPGASRRLASSRHVSLMRSRLSRTLFLSISVL